MDATFVLAEAVRSIRRHVQMTAAVVVCVAVSLTLVGVSWLLKVQVDQLKGYWYDKVEVTVFLCGDAADDAVCPDGEITETQRTAVHDALTALPVVDRVYHETKDQAWVRFTDRYEGSPVLEAVDSSTMPEPFRVKLHDPTRFTDVADAVAGLAGVEQVADQRRLLAGFFTAVAALQAAALAVAASQVGVAWLLVTSTVRLTVHSRRREVAVMRLVGASNAMIRAPFLGHAALAGLAGALVALAALAAGQQWLVGTVAASRGGGVTYVSWADYAALAPALLVAGAGLPALAGARALRRHLRT